MRAVEKKEEEREEKVMMMMITPDDFPDSLGPIIDKVTEILRVKVTCRGPHSQLRAKHRQVTSLPPPTTVCDKNLTKRFTRTREP